MKGISSGKDLFRIWLLFVAENEDMGLENTCF
jgi:hypothetical protein